MASMLMLVLVLLPMLVAFVVLLFAAGQPLALGLASAAGLVFAAVAAMLLFGITGIGTLGGAPVPPFEAVPLPELAPLPQALPLAPQPPRPADAGGVGV